MNIQDYMDKCAYLDEEVRTMSECFVYQSKALLFVKSSGTKRIVSCEGKMLVQETASR